MLLTYDELMAEVIDTGVLTGVRPEDVNGSSIDIRLGPDLMVEKRPMTQCPHCGERKQATDLFLDHLYQGNLLTQCYGCGRNAPGTEWMDPVDFINGDTLNFEKLQNSDYFILLPGHICLGHSMAYFKLPNNLSAAFELKSTQARAFLGHMLSGWCNPGWEGQLVLEFKNETRYHPQILRPGDPCGQVRFYRGSYVPKHMTYKQVGRYHAQQGPEANKEKRNDTIQTT